MTVHIVWSSFVAGYVTCIVCGCVVLGVFSGMSR